ncbi:MAG: hypothetical protein A3G71_04695 [Gammaproteobacteria bacterium RIFCSPLOWO2_12_FULL_38_14]|nr:MAG: hypothetical protein A3B69_01690 [Gammaproteobacteria bacterium RIFCSPHIGHO2_02_FULL_38_33]OGT78035.1 MAG: hypothetical protein A3G71_04695 [Gammaproteobacteria bacterium RIFCSPLOWO2_12_FULL_38_14]
MKILITGAAGFIGYHVSKRLLCERHSVVGIDNFNNVYSVQLKQDRCLLLKKFPEFSFFKIDISDRKKIQSLFQTHSFDVVIHLAARTGVRDSTTQPYAYIEDNIQGFLTILETCQTHRIKHLIFASSSSIYGTAGTTAPIVPLSEELHFNHPLAFYGITKKTNELMAYSYAHLHGLCCTGLRFFTVYGPWGRPDMAFFKFTKRILNNEPIQIYNHGEMYRDFTYVDDIAESIHLITLQTNTDPLPYQIYNIGYGKAIKLLDFVELLENLLGKKALRQYLSRQTEDMLETRADVTKLKKAFNYQPNTPLETGLKKFIDWYLWYYQKIGLPVEN